VKQYSVKRENRNHTGTSITRTTPKLKLIKSKFYFKNKINESKSN